jgi:L-malate glycosyltransferase
MKIVIISSDQYTFFVDTANELAHRGHEIHVICSKEVGTKSGIASLNKNIIFYSSFIGLLDNEQNKWAVLKIPFTVRKLRKLLDTIQPDVLHAFNLKWSGWIGAMSYFSPFILSGLGSDILSEQGADKNIILGLLRKFTIKRVTHCTFVSTQMKKQIVEINRNLDTSIFIHSTKKKIKRIDHKSIRRTREKFSLTSGKVIFSPRYIRPIYQTIEIIKAFALVHNNIDNSTLVIAGEDADDPNYFNEVLSTIDFLGISQSIKLTGRPKANEWEDLFYIADVIVSYPFNDGMPATVFETLEKGRPLVLSDVDSLKELLIDGNNALFCNKNNYHDLAHSIIELLMNDDLRKRIGENGKKTFDEIDDFNKQIDNLEKVYLKMVL